MMAVCIGIALVPIKEDSEDRVLVAAFAPMDQALTTTIEIQIDDARAFVVGDRYELTLAPVKAEDEG
jgi:hypothetical protein